MISGPQTMAVERDGWSRAYLLRVVTTRTCPRPQSSRHHGCVPPLSLPRGPARPERTAPAHAGVRALAHERVGRLTHRPHGVHQLVVLRRVAADRNRQLAHSEYP